MLTEPLYQGLQSLGLQGMARAFAAQQQATHGTLDFGDRLALLIDAEQRERRERRYVQRLRWARLGQQASLEDLDSQAPRGLDRRVVAQLGSLAFLADKLNVLITGPTGVGKSYLACALGQQACREDASVRYLRLPRLGEELARADALKRKSLFFKHLAKFQLLILDDFGLTPLADATQRDLLEIIDDRFGKTSTLVTSQLPVAKWHEYLGNPTLADAILDRLVHNAYTIELRGESMRRRQRAS
ncbi:MAG: IS21-like element helper ATPase IstB [Rhodanobacteraceae bacterium]